MKVKLLDEKCRLTKGYLSDAGFDLRVREKVALMPHETKILGVGVCIEVPEGYAGDIRPRSSISKRGLQVHYGTVDYGYTGEVGVVITNLFDDIQELEQYERVTQLVVTKINTDSVIEYVMELNSGIRGNKGFGSTGRA